MKATNNFLRIYSLLALFLLLAIPQISAQTTYSGQMAYGGSDDEVGNAMVQTTDNGFIITGITESFGGTPHPFLTKVDSVGQEEWTKDYTGTVGYAYDVIQTTDGGYMFVGGNDIFTGNGRDFLMVKTNTLGDTLWTRTYGRTGTDYAYGVKETTDGGYIMVGSSWNPNNSDNYDVMVVKTDVNGDSLWTKCYDFYTELAYDVELTSDGGYIITGDVSGNVMLLKINAVGVMQWMNSVDGGAFDVGHSVKVTSDGGFIVAGETESYGAGLSDAFLVKTDSLGVVAWAKTYGGIGNEYAYSVVDLAGTGFLLAGQTNSYGAGGVDAYLIRTDVNGKVLWSRTYGGLANEVARSVVLTNDMGLAFCGESTGFGAGQFDIYLVRADRFGNNACNQSIALTSVGVATPTESSYTVTMFAATLKGHKSYAVNAASFSTDTLCLFTQSNSTEFADIYQKTIGGLADDIAYGVARTIDGGYLFTGSTESFGASGMDVHMIKTDGLANVEWEKMLGGSGNDVANDVIQTVDGGFALAGYTRSFGSGLQDGYLIRTNSSGDTLWTRAYGNTGTDEFKTLQETSDGGFVLLGSNSSGILIIKTDQNGDTLWTKMYGGTSGCVGYGISETSDGGYIIAGETNAFGAGNYDIYVIRTDSLGDTLWTRAYGGIKADKGRSVYQVADGGFIVTGQTESHLGFGVDFFAMKINSSGTIMVARAYGIGSYSYGGWSHRNVDGTYLLGGYTSGNSGYPGDYLAIKLDSSGSLMWGKQYGYQLDPSSDDRDLLYGGIVEQSSDGGYLLVGKSESYGGGDYDLYVVKTDENGNSGSCFEYDPTVIVTTLSLSTAATAAPETIGLNVSSTATTETVTNSSSSQLNIATSVISTNVSCNGGNDGTADLSLVGGSGPYNYNWSSGGNTEDVSNLSVGTWIVTVSDVFSCSVTDTVNITEPVVLTSTISGTNITCNGGNDGTTTITPAGGTTPYNVVWNTGQVTATAINLYAGTYTVSIVDNNGCLGTNIITITEPNVLGTSISNSAVICFSGSDGTASVAAVDGTGPYTYLWSNAATSSGITGLVAGTYYVTTTDNCGKSNTDSTVISEPAELTVTGNKVDITCFGLSDGTAEVIAANGTPPYTYLWSTLATSSAISGLSSGTFFATVTDACGATKNGNVTIQEPVVLTSTMSSTDVICNGGGDGSATATPAGGTSPYTYLWNVGQITSTAVALFPGTYSVNITDVNGCLTSNGITITEPNSFGTTISNTSVTCNGGSDGTATVTAADGTSPYTYLWSNAAATSSITGLVAGTYSVTSTDSCGVSQVDSTVVTEPVVLSATGSKQNITCFGLDDGTAEVIAADGTPPYTYMWTTLETTSSISGLAPGPYSAMVTDACGATQTGGVTIIEPAVLTSSMSSTDVTCNGGGDGTSTVTASGGTSPYNYLWNTGQTTSTAIALFPGSYGVNVLDANGCLASNNISISEPAVLSASITGTTDVLCNGGSTGSAIVTPSDGTAPYTYTWDDPGSQTNGTAVGLMAGVYTVLVTDACAGTYSQPVTIGEPTALAGTIVGADVSCNGAGDGSVDLSSSGGTLPYTFAWSSLDTTEDISGKGPGTYVVTITDACAATYEDSLTLLEPAVLATSMSSTDVSCYSGGNGTATVTVSGGIGPYNYLWNNSQSNSTAIGLFPGSYSVNVTDDNGCLTSDLVTIVEPQPLSINLSSTDVNCSIGNDGTTTANASFGTPPYTYLWMPGGDTNMTATNLAEDTYTVTVTDSCGASMVDSVVVNGPGTLDLVLNASDILCNGFNDGSIDAMVSSGSPPYTFLWSTGDTTEDITGLSAGMYVLTITDSCNTTLIDSVEILEPSILTSTMTSTDISCFGMGDGTATAAPSGGIAPYLYTWNNGQFSATAVGLYAGNYSVNILDGNGCLTTNLVTINEPDALDLQVSIVDATCGNSDGSAAAMVTGGTGAYTYSWSSGGSSSTESALPDGQYGVSVLDENGCSTSDSVSVITESLTQQICIVTVDSTNSRNIVVWENPQTPNIASYNIYREIPGTGYTLVGNMLWTETSEFTDTASGIDPTVTSYRYKISAVDTCGNESAMSDYHETMHLVLPILSGGKVSLLWDNYEGFNFGYYRILRDSTGLGGNNWEAIDSVTNSNNTYTDNNPPTGTINYVVEVVATDTCTSDKTKNYNSSKSNTSTVGEPPDLLSATTSSTDVTFGMCDGTATVTATGGTPPLTYLWDGNASSQTTSTATSLCPGTYSVVVTDSLGNEVIVFASVGTLPGIDEGLEQNGIVLYPNPNTGDFRVEWNKSTNIERLLIYNTLGQIVYYVDKELTMGAHNINLDAAAPGLYYLQIEIGGKPFYQKVIIE